MGAVATVLAPAVFMGVNTVMVIPTKRTCVQ